MKLLFISPKGVYASKRIVEEAVKADLEIKHTAPVDASQENVAEFDALYSRMVYPYYTEVANLAARFWQEGKLVIEATDTDKLADFHTLSQAGIPMPKTFALGEATKLTYPFVIKTKYGFGKKEVFLIKNENAFNIHTLVYDSKDLLVQEFILADYEYKVICVGNKSLPKVLRFRIKSSEFGIEPDSFEILDAAAATDIVQLAEGASKYLNRRLCKIDILQQKDKLFVLEVNQSPGLKSFESLTGLNVAGGFVSFIKAAIGRNA